jgi:Transposase IS116/IS110/IS902 family
MTIVAERGDLTRVAKPRHVMKDLGLRPSAYASGARRRQGSITNAGHTHAPWSKGPGRLAIRRTSVVTGTCGSTRHRTSSTTSAGQPTSGGVNAIDAEAHGANPRTRWLWPWPGHSWAFCGPWPHRSP